MKFTLAVAALSVISAQPKDGGGMGPPDAAGGACTASADCASGEFCVFTVDKSTDPPTWSPSVCGAEADCNAPEPGAEKSDEPPSGPIAFCEEFMMGPKGEDSAFKLFSAGAAAVAAVAMTL